MRVKVRGSMPRLGDHTINATGKNLPGNEVSCIYLCGIRTR